MMTTNYKYYFVILYLKVWSEETCFVGHVIIVQPNEDKMSPSSVSLIYFLR